jgi:hypothetical protein
MSDLLINQNSDTGAQALRASELRYRRLAQWLRLLY